MIGYKIRVVFSYSEYFFTSIKNKFSWNTDNVMRRLQQKSRNEENHWTIIYILLKNKVKKFREN